MPERLMIQTDNIWIIYDNTPLTHEPQLSPQNSQDLDSEDRFPYILASASNSGTTRETQIFFQTNQIRRLGPAEPASGCTMSTTSHQSTGRTPPTPKRSTSLPALESLPDKSHGGGLTCHSKLCINSLCLFPFGWPAFIPTCSKAECWIAHGLSSQKPYICK